MTANVGSRYLQQYIAVDRHVSDRCMGSCSGNGAWYQVSHAALNIHLCIELGRYFKFQVYHTKYHIYRIQRRPFRMLT